MLLLKEIEFADVCTGPPWTTGDVVETKRRKEMEDTDLTPTDTAKLFNQSTLLNPPIDTPRFNHDLFASTILWILQPTPGVLEYSRHFTHITISSEIGVPLPYIRAQIPRIYEYFFLNERPAAHDLHLTSVNHENYHNSNSQSRFSRSMSRYPAHSHTTIKFPKWEEIETFLIR
jgi:hypothetical protein